MLKSKFQHMGEKEHYKMYKAGKTWVFANVIALSLGTALIAASVDTVKAAADDTNTRTTVSTDTMTSSSSAVLATPAQSTSATKTIAGSESANLMKADSTATTGTVNAPLVQKPTTSAIPASAPSATTAGSVASQFTSTQAKTFNNTSSVKTDVSYSQTASITSEAKTADPTSIASTSDSDTAKNSEDSQTNQLTSSAASQTVTQPQTAPNQSTSKVAQISAANSTQATALETPQSAAIKQSESLTTMQPVTTVDASKFVSGTKVTTVEDGTVTISLPAGASANDILQAKQILSAQHVTKASITAIDAAVDSYENGVTQAVVQLQTNALITSSGQQGLRNLMGDTQNVGTPTDAKTGTTLFARLNTLPLDPDGKVVATTDTKAKSFIADWVNSQLTALTYDQVISYDVASSTSVLKGGLTGQAQTGYLDTIKDYLRGCLTAEAYYLWLVKSTDNTDNTEYVGPQGDADKDQHGDAAKFEIASTQVRTAEDLSTLTGDQATMYQGGFENAINWFLGSASSAKNANTDMTTSGAGIQDTSAAIIGQSETLMVTSANKLKNSSNFTGYPITARFPTKASITDQALPQSTDNSLGQPTDNSLEQAIEFAVSAANYDSWEHMVGMAFKQATIDALAGKAVALDVNQTVTDYVLSSMPTQFQDGFGAKPSTRSGLYAYAYLTAKGYLDGYSAKIPETTATGGGNTGIKGGVAQTVTVGKVTVNGVKKTTSTPVETPEKIPSPLDLAIYSVLTGTSETYNVTGTDSIVSKEYQTNPNTAKNADWLGDSTNQYMYNVIWSVANQAKTDFLSDIQLKINQGNASALSDIDNVLPTADKQGMLSASQYTYYKANAYVYYKVFQALYNSYFAKTDSQGKAINVIQVAINDADDYVKQNGDSHYGHPTAQGVTAAQATNPELVAQADPTKDITLNGDVDYTGGYSENTDGSVATGVTKLTPDATAQTIIKGTELGATDASATKTIQNAIDYAYVHEESMAIPAYEAGYAAVQTHLNVTPDAKSPSLPDPKNDTFVFENTNTVEDTLAPVLDRQNADGSSSWTVHYGNADGTATTVVITRGIPTGTDTMGSVTSMHLTVEDKGGNVLDDGMMTVDPTSLFLPGIEASYPTVQLNAAVTSDPSRKTTVVVAYDNAGNLTYSFVRDAKNTVNTTVTGKLTTGDGTSSGKLYQAGWDYRKSFISQATITQEVADPEYKDGKTGSNKLTADQVYAGFFESQDKSGNPVKNSSVQLDPNNNVNEGYGTYAPHTISNLDGSSVIITLHVNGDVDYDVFDTDKNETKGTLKAGTPAVTITNNDMDVKDAAPSMVTIARTANNAVTVSETGVEALMQNTLDVQNNAKTANASLIMGENIEPSFTSTTIVTPVSALHTGVLFTKDASFGTDGIASTYDDDKSTNSSGLSYQGSVPDPTSVDNTKDYGQARNTTTTIQYVADNATNSGTGTTASINTTTITPSVTIQLGKDGNGVVQSSTSFAATGVVTNGTDANVGTEIFDWNNVKNLPTGWTYNDANKTLTYAPTDDASKKALVAALTSGTYKINWSAATDATAPALVDKYNDVMNLAVDAQVKSENNLTATIDTSDTTKVNEAHQYTFSNAGIVKATQVNDPNNLVTAFIKSLAGTAGKTYTGTMNGLALPSGVSSVTLNADGSVTVTYDPDKATANYDAATKTNTIKLVLPFTVDANGKYVVDTTDTTGATPLANLTLNMTMTSDATVSYQAAAGGTNTTVNSTNVVYANAGTNLQPATNTTAALGSNYTISAPATISATDTTNYTGVKYELINGTATNTPTAVSLTGQTLKFGQNKQTYLYAKTYGTVWNVTSTSPTLTDTDTASATDGISTTIDLSAAVQGFNTSTLAFTPDADTAAKYTVTVTQNGTTLTVTYKPKDDTAAAVQDFLQGVYQTGLDMNGWLTDTATAAGSTTPTLNNAMYIETKAAPLKLADYSKTATINVGTTGNGYDATAHTYTFDVPASVLGAKELAALASTGQLILTSGSSTTDIAKGYATANAANWKNISGLKLTLNTDGTAHVVATLTAAAADSNVQDAAVLFNGPTGTNPAATGINLELTLTNDLTQESTGLPTGLKPVYTPQAGQSLGSIIAKAETPAVAGYNVTGAVDQNGTALTITTNPDGSASYTSGKFDFGSNAGAFKADQITWTYAQNEIDGSLGTQTKVYGASDPSTAYAVTLPAWLTAPTWTTTDFERDNDVSEDVGQHAIKLSATGIADLQAQNKNFTITAATLGKLADGILTITADGVKATTTDASRKFNGQSIDADHKDAAGQDYQTSATFTSTGVTPAVNTNLLRDLDFLVETAAATNPLAGLNFTASQVFWYADNDAAKTPIDLATTSHAGKYDWKLNAAGIQAVKDHLGKNYTMTPAQMGAIGGSYTISQGDATGTATSATRAYDGQSFTQNSNGTDGKTFDPTINFDADSGLTAWQVPDGDYVFTDASGATVAASDLKNAGTYTWTLTANGQKAFYDNLGSRNGTEADTNYAVAASSKLSGTYTINPVAITITGPSLTKTYDGNAYTPTDDNGKTDTATTTGMPANGATPDYGLTSISNIKDVGTTTITVTPTTDASVNKNYTITVVAGSLVISKRPLTVATANTPASPINSTTPADNPQMKTSVIIKGATKVYDNNAATDPTTFTIQGPSVYKTFTVPTGLVASDFDASGIDGQNVGNYTVKLSAAGLKKIQEANPNFTFDATDVQDALFVITARPVTITAENNHKVFGATDPAFTATVSAITGNANSGLISGDKLMHTFSRQAGENTGNHTISVVNGTNPNYAITDVAGALTITPKLTIKYVDQDGNELKEVPQKEISDQKSGTAITIDHPSASGFMLDSNQSNSYTLTADGNQTVTVRYRQNAAVITNYYVKGTTNKIKDSVTTNSGVGLTYTTVGAGLTGYTLVGIPTNATGTYATTNADVNYYYTVNYTLVATLPDGTIINVTMPSGTGSPDNQTDPTGGFPDIPGYTRTSTPVVPDKPGLITVVYTPNPENVTVHYYFKGTTTSIPGMTAGITVKGVFGQRYRIDATSFSGYTVVETPDNTTGTFGLNNKSVNYYYLMNYNIVPVDENGQVIPNIPTISFLGLPGAPIPMSEFPEIPGYTLVTKTVQVPGQPNQVRVTYVKQTAVPPVTPVPPTKPTQPGIPVSNAPVEQVTGANRLMVRAGIPVSNTPVEQGQSASAQLVSSQAGGIQAVAEATCTSGTVALSSTLATPEIQKIVTPIKRVSTPVWASQHEQISQGAGHSAALPKQSVNELPRTNEHDYIGLIATGLSLMVGGFIFLGFRKYRRQ